MLESVYCVKCRKALNETDTFCKYCGADQRHPAQRTETIQQIFKPEMPIVLPSVRAESGVDRELDELKQEVEEEAKHRPYLALLGHRLISTEQGDQFVIGIVYNDALEECLEAEIRINVLDKDGGQIASLSDSTFNIGKQNNWKFAIPVSFPGAINYNIINLRGDYITYRLEAELHYETMRRQQSHMEAVEAAVAYSQWEAAMYQNEMEIRERQAELWERQNAQRQEGSWSVWISFPF